MIKNTTVNTILTPEENFSVTDSILGRVVEAQTRWSPGSLLASIFGSLAVAQTVMISPGQVVAGVPGHLQNARNAITGATGYGIEYAFGVEASDSKSKVLIAEEVSLVCELRDSMDELVDDVIVSGMLTPPRPSYTALAAVNKLESLAFANFGGYVIFVDQNTETLYLYTFDTAIHAEAAIAAVLALGSGNTFVPSVAFLTEPPTSGGSDVPSFGWE